MPAKNLTPFSTYLPKDVKSKLERLAAEKGWSAAQLARHVLSEYVANPRRR
jgi:hypothetical protein